MEIIELTLKNEKERTFRFIILFFVVLHIIFFIFLLFDEIFWKKGVIGMTLIALYTGFRLLVAKAGGGRFSYGSGFFFLFAFFFTIPWLWLVDAILFIVSTITLNKTTLYFSSAYIEKRNIPGKKYPWHLFTNVVLKDNLLTLDFKSNKLLQAEISASNTDEAAFNTFVKQQLVNL